MGKDTTLPKNRLPPGRESFRKKIGLPEQQNNAPATTRSGVTPNPREKKVRQTGEEPRNQFSTQKRDTHLETKLMKKYLGQGVAYTSQKTNRKGKEKR